MLARRPLIKHRSKGGISNGMPLELVASNSLPVSQAENGDHLSGGVSAESKELCPHATLFIPGNKQHFTKSMLAELAIEGRDEATLYTLCPVPQQQSELYLELQRRPTTAVPSANVPSTEFVSEVQLHSCTDKKDPPVTGVDTDVVFPSVSVSGYQKEPRLDIQHQRVAAVALRNEVCTRFVSGEHHVSCSAIQDPSATTDAVEKSKREVAAPVLPLVETPCSEGRESDGKVKQNDFGNRLALERLMRSSLGLLSATSTTPVTRRNVRTLVGRGVYSFAQQLPRFEPTETVPMQNFNTRDGTEPFRKSPLEKSGTSDACPEEESAFAMAVGKSSLESPSPNPQANEGDIQTFKAERLHSDVERFQNTLSPLVEPIHTLSGNMRVSRSPESMSQLHDRDQRDWNVGSDESDMVSRTVSDEGERSLPSRAVPFDDSTPCSADTKASPERFYELFGCCFARNSTFSVDRDVPNFGNDGTETNEVIAFYKFWFRFKSSRDFSHQIGDLGIVEKDRATRRKMLRGNEKRLRQITKNETIRIRKLVRRAYMNDPRIRRHRIEKIQRRSLQNTKIRL